MPDLPVEPNANDDVIVVRETPHGALTWRWAKDGPRPGDIIYVPAARAEAAEAALRRVEALCDKWAPQVSMDDPALIPYDDIRAALAAEETTHG